MASRKLVAGTCTVPSLVKAAFRAAWGRWRIDHGESPKRQFRVDRQQQRPTLRDFRWKV